MPTLLTTQFSGSSMDGRANGWTLSTALRTVSEKWVVGHCKTLMEAKAQCCHNGNQPKPKIRRLGLVVVLSLHARAGLASSTAEASSEDSCKKSVIPNSGSQQPAHIRQFGRLTLVSLVESFAKTPTSVQIVRAVGVTATRDIVGLSSAAGLNLMYGSFSELSEICHTVQSEVAYIL